MHDEGEGMRKEKKRRGIEFNSKRAREIDKERERECESNRKDMDSVYSSRVYLQLCSLGI